jgi:circadian clock protein KaiC
MHLATMLRLVRDFRPRVVVVDPISNMLAAGTADEAQAMLLRLVDALKDRQITALFTNLSSAGEASLEQTDLGISSIVDTWILLRDIELGGERNRGLYVLKSRGMAHSNQIREFLISDHGIDVVDAYIGASGVLTGSARAAQEALEKAALLAGQQEAARRKRELERKRVALERQISGLRSDYKTESVELRQIDEQVGTSTLMLTSERAASGRLRQADTNVAARTLRKPKHSRKNS